MTASRKFKDLRSAGPGFIFFGLLAPNMFAPMGIIVAHTYAYLTHTEFKPGTYVLFAVLCGAASYIAVPRCSGWRSPRRARPCRWPHRWV